MRPTDTGITSQGDLGGVKVAMGIDPMATAHLMSVLTNLYSDPVLAVLREYSTNAWDSHVQAGTNRPIEVTLPNALSPFLKIKDFGLGLSVDDIVEIYSQYGASTKRGTNDAVGMLGLGCKSALTYTNQFTLTSVRGGVKVIVSVSLTDAGTGTMEIIDTVSTDEPNGVEVTIPVKDRYVVRDKAYNFFRFWEPGSVLIDGNEPNYIGGDEVDKDILLVDGIRGDYIVMGNVAYPSKTLFDSGYRDWGIVAKVPIGAVNFTPSREQLHYTAMTEAVVEDIKNRFTNAIAKRASEDIDKAADYKDALERFQKWNSRFNNIEAKYKGEDIPRTLTFGKDAAGKDISVATWYPNRQWSNVTWSKGISLFERNRETNLIVTGFTSNLSSSQKGRVTKWKELTGSRGYPVYFVDKLPDSPWWSIYRTVSWDEIKKATKPEPKERRKFENYPKIDSKGLTTDGQVDTSKEIIFWSPAQVRVGDSTVRNLFPDAELIPIPTNRHDKFQRDFPKAVNLRTKVNAIYDEAYKALTEEDILHENLMDSFDATTLRKLPVDKILDPDIVRAVKVIDYGYDNSRINRWKSARALKGKVTGGFWGLDIPNRSNPLERYPLTRKYHGQYIDHMVIYINAVYQIYKENNEVQSD